MNPREIILNAILRKKVDKVPKHAFFTKTVENRLMQKLNCENINRYFGIEVEVITLKCFGFSKNFRNYFKYLDTEDRKLKLNWEDWNQKIHGNKTIDEWGSFVILANFMILIE